MKLTVFLDKDGNKVSREKAYWVIQAEYDDYNGNRISEEYGRPKTHPSVQVS